MKAAIEAGIDDEPPSKEALRRIREALEDLEAGRVYTTERVRRELLADPWGQVKGLISVSPP